MVYCNEEPAARAQSGSAGKQEGFSTVHIQHTRCGDVAQWPGERRFPGHARRRRFFLVADDQFRVLRVEWIGDVPFGQSRSWGKAYRMERNRILERLGQISGLRQIVTTTDHGIPIAVDALAKGRES